MGGHLFFVSTLLLLIALESVKGDERCYTSDLQALLVHLRELTTRTNKSITELQGEVAWLKMKNEALEETVRGYIKYLEWRSRSQESGLESQSGDQFLDPGLVFDTTEDSITSGDISGDYD